MHSEVTFSNAWDVFMLFLLPFGGGIPGGVLLAQSHGIAWPIMAVLYFLSDVVLALLFEPVMLLLIFFAKKSVFLTRWREAFKITMKKTTEHYGTGLGPLALIMVAFGVDPMTGRSAAAAAGHGFVAGWMIAIAGDMLYFGVLMISTLWLHSVLGDGTWTMIIILVVMMILPPLVRRVRRQNNGVK